MPLFGAANAWITPPIAVSVLALLFTVASFWWIQVRRGRLRSFGPSAYAASYGKDKTLVNLPLVIHNTGPAPLAVINARLRLRPANMADGSGEIVLYWHALRTAIYTDAANGGRTFASPFAVEGRKSVEKYLEFQRNVPNSQLAAVPYRATVDVRVEPSARPSRWVKLVRFTLHAELITEAREPFLQRSNDPDLMGEKSQTWVQG
ncbi:hypothetical protein Q0Z83_085020 [Actinoplanes sichuanensis]|nr:hypothetical protein Q0Z83_085020 [Actinoplanes sichuanensis]